MKRNYDEASVVRSLSKKKEISIDGSSKIIKVLKDAENVGNGSWGKIDYLCHYHGYIVSRVVRVSSKKNNNNNYDNDSVSFNDNKINMAKRSKSIMKKVKFEI